MLGGMRHTLLALTLTLLAATSAFAQSGGTAVAITNTPVYVAPDGSRTPLRIAAQGTVFTVLAEQGEWTQVQFKDPQWGIRVGYVATKALQFRRPELEPMDLSTTGAAPRTAAPAEVPARARAQQPSPRPWDVPARSFERVWIDVNLGVAIAADETVTLEHSDRLFGETRTFRTAYENPTGASFDFGGGVMFTPQVGVGVSFAGTAHQAAPELFVQVPHPNFFNASASDTADADEEFQRVEGSVHLQLMGATEFGDNLRLRVFGGPTYFRLQHDLVSNIRYLQAFAIFNRANAVDITTYDSVDKVEGTGWGYHVGGDVSFFFTRVVGLGAFARYSRGTVDLVEPLRDSEVELKVGGLQFGGGLRLKF
jgi:hypothetical protein